MPVEIVTIPCLSDNYAYLLHDPDSAQTALIDVPDAAPIQKALDQRGWTLSHVLLTHHHWDHVDGLADLALPAGTQIIGAAADAHRLPDLTHQVREGDALTLCGQRVEILDVSGHTVGHVAFYLPDLPACFTADSLMVFGCGRLFEGTPEQMWHSLSKLASLPPQTAIYSGHDYAAGNSAFALSLLPHPQAVVDRAKRLVELGRTGQPVVPVSLAEELATNPFLRADSADVRQAVNLPDAPVEQVFAEVRRRKDQF